MKANWRLAGVALFILLLDQLTKSAIVKHLGYENERVIVPGFFRLVLWGNTGAAWNSFQGRNAILAAVAIAALVILFLLKDHFAHYGLAGRLALALLFGGILGNLADRLLRHHVIDFLYFYIVRRDGSELGFPAFNVADSAISIGVALLLLSALRKRFFRP
jgi:signal peptidase II